MFRRIVVCLLLTVFLPTVAEAQPKIPRIGYLSNLSRDSQVARFESFRHGLRDLGHIDGQNIFIEARYAEGSLDQLPALAAELVKLKVDVIVTGGGTPTQAAQKVTNTIPIVMTNVNDPVALGLVATFARPGGNVNPASRLFHRRDNRSAFRKILSGMEIAVFIAEV
jgi:putative ABC transport system substrate-binding protein